MIMESEYVDMKITITLFDWDHDKFKLWCMCMFEMCGLAKGFHPALKKTREYYLPRDLQSIKTYQQA